MHNGVFAGCAVCKCIPYPRHISLDIRNMSLIFLCTPCQSVWSIHVCQGSAAVDAPEPRRHEEDTGTSGMGHVETSLAIVLLNDYKHLQWGT